MVVDITLAFEAAAKWGVCCLVAREHDGHSVEEKTTKEIDT